MSNLSTLEQSLLSARKFMDHDTLKMEDTSPQYGREQAPEMQLLSSLPPGQSPTPTPKTENMAPHSSLTPDRINSSSLPDVIKEAMISHPIPDINANTTLNDDFLSKIADKMNDDKYSVNSMRSASNNSVNSIPQPGKPMQEQKTVTPTQNNIIPSPTNMSHNVDIMSLKDEIKLMISESLDEIIESKVNKLLTESKNVKENLQFRIGSKVFTGRISKVKTIKG